MIYTNKKLLLIDGHNYLFRAYFGIPPEVKLPNGLPGNAVYGFFAFLRRAVQFVRPELTAVIFDSETGIQTKQLIDNNYKANRDRAPALMFEQLPTIKALLSAIGILSVENPSEEADDIIGSLAVHFGKEGGRCYISSSDHDFLQLLSGSVQVVKEKRGQHVLVTPDIFNQEFNLHPSQYVDYLALMGDASDNIKGIPRVGPKTARRLLETYNSLDAILSAAHVALAGKSINVREHQQAVTRNRSLLTINTSLNVQDYVTGLKEEVEPSLLQYTTNQLLKQHSLCQP